MQATSEMESYSQEDEIVYQNICANGLAQKSQNQNATYFQVGWKWKSKFLWDVHIQTDNLLTAKQLDMLVGWNMLAS